MQVNDLVRFTDTVQCDAGRFCLERNITGRVVSAQPGVYIVDCGLPYTVHARPDDITTVAKSTEIPQPECDE